jgi:Mor family transcriptional regulator
MNTLTKSEILEIRNNNEALIKGCLVINQSERYRRLSKKFKLSEWTIRWICQGRDYLEHGGYIEDSLSHESTANRSLTHSDALWIRNNFNLQHSSIRDLANKFGTSQSTIRRILLGQTYRDVGGTLFSKKILTLLKNQSNNSAVTGSPATTPLKKSFNSAILNSSKNAAGGNNQPQKLSTSNMASNLSETEIYLIKHNYIRGYNIKYISQLYNVSEKEIVDILQR